MEVDDIPQITPNIDYSSIQPIHQKRTIAFVNHFVLSTVSFLNEFAASCEHRLMQFEYKLQKVEASLLILESQLSSIPDLNNVNNKPSEVNIDLPDVVNSAAESSEQEKLEKSQEERSEIKENDDNKSKNDNQSETNVENVNVIEDIRPKASADPRFSKFFKMLQYGVPHQAVKLKMVAEGIDPEVLDNPNAVIPG